MHIGVLSDPENFHTQKWSLALQQAGAKVTIFSFSDYQYNLVPCVKVPPRFTRRGKITYASYLFSLQGLRKVIQEYKIDILNPINATPFGVWAARSQFRPIACISMGADILEFPPSWKESTIPEERIWSSKSADNLSWSTRILNRIKWHLFRRNVRKALEAAEFITGDNLELVRAVREWFQIPTEKVHLNRWGIEEELFEISEIRKAELAKEIWNSKGAKTYSKPSWDETHLSS